MDDIIKGSVEKNTEEFIKSIHSDVVCALASSYNKGRPCSILSEPKRGSYNICYPIVFKPMADGSVDQKWVVRIPLEPRVKLVDEKLENEVAVMRFVHFAR
jgi:hypothetical protein